VRFMSSTNSRFWFLALFLGLLAILFNAWNMKGEAVTVRKSLEEFPTTLGGWHQVGSDEKFDSETERVLGADDYLSRTFEANEKRGFFYVGYYATQREGRTYHSPQNCLPGAGWVMRDHKIVKISPKNGAPEFDSNYFIIDKGDQKSVLLYWYQGRGRILANEYWGKFAGRMARW
jgi:EpsI family protein